MFIPILYNPYRKLIIELKYFYKSDGEKFMVLTSKLFTVNITDDGVTSELYVNADSDKMDFLAGQGKSGVPYLIPQRRGGYFTGDTIVEPMQLKEVFEADGCIIAVYEDARLKATVTKGFRQNGNYYENYRFENIFTNDEFFCRGDIAISASFADKQDTALYSLKHCCDTHIWCGENSSYIELLKNGLSENNIGIVVTKGDLSAYSLNRNAEFTCGHKPASMSRGMFLLHPSAKVIECEKPYELEFEYFVFKDETDFYSKLKNYDTYIQIDAPTYTAMADESIEFTAKYNKIIETASVKCDRECIPFEVEDNKLKVKYKTEDIGVHRFDIEINGVKTHASFMYMCDFETLLKKRAYFICENQQYLKDGNSLDGAYLVYDNEDKHMYYDTVYTCHNASTERLGMAFTVCAYLRRNNDEKIKASLKRFADFYEREIFDPDTGVVFYGIHRDPGQKRLYNAPWVISLMSEFYYIFGEKRYLEIMMRMARRYYEIGGGKHYSNGLLMLQTVNALKDAKMEDEMRELTAFYKMHVDTMLENDLDYPAHEAIFEQTIIAPVVAFSAQLYMICGEEKYREASMHHLAYLKRFSGSQPDCRLHFHPIRYWDVFYAGKTGVYGDTFPHYWSCLSAWSALCTARANNDTQNEKYAFEEIKNCYCLYNDKFEGTCGHLYPLRINGVQCEKDDPWSNDQDFVLYFAEKMYSL